MIHSVVTTAANVQDLTAVAELLHSDEGGVYGDTVYRGIAKRPVMAGHVEHPFRVIKQQFGFQKTRLRGLAKNRCKFNVLAALSNLFQAQHQFLAAA